MSPRENGALEPRAILAQLLRGRETVVPVGARMKFTIQRPDEFELIRMRGTGGNVEVGLSMLQSKVIGWEGVLESDILPRSGADVPVPWDRVLYSAWIADRPDLWPPLISAFDKAINDHGKALEARAGN